MTPTLTLESVLPALPEIYLAIAVCVVLLVDVFAGRAAPRVTPTLTLLVLAAGAALLLAFAQVPSTVELFSGMYVTDPLANLLKLFAMLFVAVALLYSRHYLEARGLLKGEYYVLVLEALPGIFVMTPAGSLVNRYIGGEFLGRVPYAPAVL